MMYKNFLLLLGFIFLLFFAIPIHINSNEKLEVEFRNFIKKYNKSYENETVYHQRFDAFKKSLTNIDNLNSLRTSNHSAIYGITKFSDMFEEEFKEKHLFRSYGERLKKTKNVQRQKRNLNKIPVKIDWRNENVVTPINNQHSCGGCWAFSTIQIIESMYAIKTGNLTKFSVQQIIDCAGFNNNGCNGGDVCTALEWLKRYDVTIENETKYPLHLRNEACKMNRTLEGIKIYDYKCEDLTDSEETILSYLANHGPIAAAINALSWQNYLGGIIQYHCHPHPMLLNHAVQIVGYNLAAEIPHYIVRNSWGEEFGDHGYLYIATGSNLCGLATEVSLVEV